MLHEMHEDPKRLDVDLNELCQLFFCIGGPATRNVLPILLIRERIMPLSPDGVQNLRLFTIRSSSFKKRQIRCALARTCARDSVFLITNLKIDRDATGI